MFFLSLRSTELRVTAIHRYLRLPCRSETPSLLASTTCQRSADRHATRQWSPSESLGGFRLHSLSTCAPTVLFELRGIRQISNFRASDGHGWVSRPRAQLHVSPMYAFDHAQSGRVPYSRCHQGALLIVLVVALTDKTAVLLISPSSWERVPDAGNHCSSQ